MNFRNFFIFFLPGLLALLGSGCGNSTPPGNEEPKVDTLPPANLRPASAWESPISRAEFNAFWHAPDPLKEEYLAPWGKKIKFSEMVIFTGDSLMQLRLGNHQSLFLKDSVPAANDTAGVDFQFDGYLETTGHYQIAKVMYADFETWLVDIRNGKITVMDGNPIVSPSGNRILSISSDLELFILPNGFELFEMGDSGLTYSKAWMQPYYAPMGAFWDSDSTLVVRAIDLENVGKMQDGKLIESFYRINVNRMPSKDELKDYFYNVVVPARKKANNRDSLAGKNP